MAYLHIVQLMGKMNVVRIKLSKGQCLCLLNEQDCCILNRFHSQWCQNHCSILCSNNFIDINVVILFYRLFVQDIAMDKLYQRTLV